MDEEETKEEDEFKDFDTYKLLLPDDDFDEDDEIDARIDAERARKKQYVIRGGFFGTQ